MKNELGNSAAPGWKIILIVAAVLLLVAGTGILIYLRIGEGLMSTPVPGREDSAKQDNLDSLRSLRSLPYVAWTDEDVDETQTGVIKHDENQASPGYNIYTNEVDQVFIMDMGGQIVHSWKLPGKTHCEHAEWLDTGEILVICEGESIIKLDWSGQILWEHEAGVNHDVALRPDGSMLVSVMDRPKKYKAVPSAAFNSILSLSSDGMPTAVWSTYVNLVQLQRSHPPLRLDKMTADDPRAQARTYDYYHLNTIEVLPDTPLGQKDQRFQAGNILLSLRNASVIVILDKDTMELQWSWGPGILDFQHMPTMIENGNLLVFDNGTHRNYTRVVEVEPISKEIVWEYKASPPSDFLSKWRGSNQRLPNGNTFICDSENGRTFEVTRSGEIVWEFWNPEIKNGKRKRIYRMMRVPEEIVDRYLNGQQSAGL